MPTLHWLNDEEARKQSGHLPYRLLEADPKLSYFRPSPDRTIAPEAKLSGGGQGEVETENMLIQGDNLEALKALLPYYAGQVKCIYIDPPYNTGNEGWVYNDNTNSPEIRQWLGKVVGAEAEDLSRHDKWLCMMYPRLAVMRDF